MDTSRKDLIHENIESVQERIHNSAKIAGRDPKNISLVAVAKQHPASDVKALSDLGIKKIAESYLKEALFKIDLLKEYNIEWHMVGPIQKGKEKDIAARFMEVHSLDNVKTAKKLNEFAILYERTLPVYLEFNVSGEETKHGWGAWNEKEWPGFIPELGEILDLSNLSVKGLMTMAPYSNNPQDARPYFQRLRHLRKYLNKEFPHTNMNGLSMGMSGDFEVAIEEGATVLRIGSALLGPR